MENIFGIAFRKKQEFEFRRGFLMLKEPFKLSYTWRRQRFDQVSTDDIA